MTTTIPNTLSQKITTPTLLAVLREFFNYDPATGEFTRAKKIAHNQAVGEVPGTFHKHSGYRYIVILGVRFKEHRLAWLYVHGVMPNGEIDHINDIKDDNRIYNLREATRAQNEHNKPITSKNSSGYRGVFFRKKTGNYTSSIWINGKHHRLGGFDTAEEAAQAYQEAARLHRGEFAYGATKS